MDAQDSFGNSGIPFACGLLIFAPKDVPALKLRVPFERSQFAVL